MKRKRAQMNYANTELRREDVDELEGPAVLEFGTDWCGYCARSQPAIKNALAEHPDVRHIKVEDGRGRRLGRSFGVKLWPTLVFLKGGHEVARVVRPRDAEPVEDALKKIA